VIIRDRLDALEKGFDRTWTRSELVPGRVDRSQGPSTTMTKTAAPASRTRRPAGRR